ncbi:MAG: hypothetical protein LBD74_04950 [Spirochaetaceae bacterium]|jgi:hypothetical protein|nr:hypothetical protein [Spirochaetaceae bacterium]
MGRIGVFAALGLCLIAASCMSAPVKTIRCRMEVYGNEPHTYLGIRSEEDDKVYAVYAPGKEAELRSLQGRTLEMTVRFLKQSQGYGSLFLKDGTVQVLTWKPALEA